MTRLCHICNDNIDGCYHNRIYCDVCMQVPKIEREKLMENDHDEWISQTDKKVHQDRMARRFGVK